MTIAEKLDLAIKLKVTGTTDGAYVIERGNGEKIFKATYMTKTEWAAFEADMKANIFLLIGHSFHKTVVMPSHIFN